MNLFDDERFLIGSLTEFLKIHDDILTPTAEYPNPHIYRGHSDAIHALMPGIGRIVGSNQVPDIKTLLFLEKSAFNAFEIQTYHELKEQNRFILLAVAQHHGMLTRLLDWTFSPLVALFFAVENEREYDKNGALFTFIINKEYVNVLRDKTRDVSPFADNIGEYNYLYVPSLTPRIMAQKGVFQLFRNPHIAFDHLELSKFIIPAKAKSGIKADLFNMGINYSALFPDLDGISKNLNHIYFNK